MFGLPAYQEILILTIALTLFMTILAKKLTNQNEMKRIKDDMNLMKEHVKTAQKAGNTDEMNASMKMMLSLNKRYFMSSIRPMLASLVIFSIVIIIFNFAYSDARIFIPFGGEIGWFWWYFLLSIPSSYIFRKCL